MSATPVLDDLAIEAIIRGDEVAPEVGHLAAFAARVRAVGHGPAPRPTPALARLLTDGGAPAARLEIGDGGRRRSRRRRTLAKAASLSVVAKVGLGATAAAATVGGAGAASMLPGDAGRMARYAIEVVTPVQFADHDDVGIVGDGADHGDRVSSDATGESDGVPGVDGREISDDAPGASRRPGETPANPGSPGAGGAPGAPSTPPLDPDAPGDGRPPTLPGSSPAEPAPGTPTTTGPAGPEPGDPSAALDDALGSSGNADGPQP